MTSKQNQEFRSSGLLSLISLIALTAGIIALPWNRDKQDHRVAAARQKAEVIGYQVAQIYREATGAGVAPAKNSGRSLASIGPSEAFTLENLRSTGTMGQDPWGEPYRYRILTVDSAGGIRVLVWSSGPNKKAETLDLENEEHPVKDQPAYLGDDMGVLLTVAQK